MKTPTGSGIGIGVGLALGAAVGAAMDTVALGVATGLVLGAVFEAANSFKKNSKKSSSEDSSAATLAPTSEAGIKDEQDTDAESMNLKSRILVGILVALVIVVAGIFFFTQRAHAPVSDRTNTQAATTTPLQFEVVTDEAAQEKGLGGRADIPPDYVMLFVFPKEDRYGFWMKDMLTSIDIIWLSDTGSILGIEASASPATYPNVFYPPEPVRYVLETRAGEAARRGWIVGTVVPLPATATSQN